MPVGLIAKKLGMTRLLRADGMAEPVTVLQAGPCVVTAVRSAERDGYTAVQLGYQEVHKSRLTKPELGHLGKNKLPSLKILREFRTEPDEEWQVGQQITAAHILAESVVDVIGVSKGKGFAGVVKRHHFSRGPMTHGSKSHRRPASTGGTDAARVFPGKRSPGHLGNERCTVRNARVLRVDADRSLLFVKGTVPGPSGVVVMVRPVRLAQKKAKRGTAKK